MQTGSMFRGEISTFASASCRHADHALAFTTNLRSRVNRGRMMSCEHNESAQQCSCIQQSEQQQHRIIDMVALIHAQYDIARVPATCRLECKGQDALW